MAGSVVAQGQRGTRRVCAIVAAAEQQIGSGDGGRKPKSEIKHQRSAVFARGEEMAEEVASDEEDDAGCSTECGVQEPEVRRGHFL